MGGVGVWEVWGCGRCGGVGGVGGVCLKGGSAWSSREGAKDARSPLPNPPPCEGHAQERGPEVSGDDGC